MIGEGVIDAHGVRYDLWTGDNAVGYRVQYPDGKVDYLYFNPSLSDDGRLPNVFVYRGPFGDPTADLPMHHYLLDQ